MKVGSRVVWIDHYLPIGYDYNKDEVYTIASILEDGSFTTVRLTCDLKVGHYWFKYKFKLANKTNHPKEEV